MNSSFQTWLADQLRERSWSQSELARRAGVSPSLVNQVMSGATNPGLTFYLGIAKAFSISNEEVLRRAGVLDRLSELPPVFDGWASRLMALPPDRRADAVGAMDAVLTALESYRRPRT